MRVKLVAVGLVVSGGLRWDSWGKLKIQAKQAREMENGKRRTQLEWILKERRKYAEERERMSDAWGRGTGQAPRCRAWPLSRRLRRDGIKVGTQRGAERGSPSHTAGTCLCVLFVATANLIYSHLYLFVLFQSHRKLLTNLAVLINQFTVIVLTMPIIIETIQIAMCQNDTFDHFSALCDTISQNDWGGQIVILG